MTKKAEQVEDSRRKETKKQGAEKGAGTKGRKATGKGSGKGNKKAKGQDADRIVRSPKIAEETLNQMFSPEWLRGTAESTGMVRRERKIDPTVMFWVLVLSFGVRLQRTLSSLKRNYEKEGGTTISYGSWYPRFTPELVAFLRECVTHGIEHLAQQPGRKLGEKLARFDDILIQDSTIIRLHEALADKWPAARSNRVAAGVKVGMLVSAIAAGPKRIALYGERTSEVKTINIGPWVKNRILLLDLGFSTSTTRSRGSRRTVGTSFPV